ncbi:MAG: UDP-3-O-(3-hydroxymyristoyl)glucosamine N-acyltransferase, partial [Bacteroidetes bacterium]|nr:UDP-3-O-(3-hydroxymyristoyl)glucosamine N-acyltransferase [Bacteroidota bacterium]
MKFSIPQTLEDVATILGCDFVGASDFAVLGMNEI